VENMAGDFERMTRSSPNMQYTCIQKPSLIDRTNFAKETSRSSVSKDPVFTESVLARQKTCTISRGRLIIDIFVKPSDVWSNNVSFL